ncbi:TPA: major capsid protein [Enterobacter hormaechei subsp. xiangfangensis]|uniref:Major capsid protein E n=2 Tax=Enterobacter hormaechei TaxID=158836 RepID=A0A822WFT6_9ENTR|nr:MULTISPECIES: major capsid protein [Enterobacteriaceae]HDR2605222.1 major capsid protein [Enterobacter hormaechei subsp. oharae]AWZ99122.1 phage major capsid E family protein [Enterobacter hormaechei]EHN8733792.1 major capsid protein [Enterobacter hormaechei]EHN8932883.1 major capsid protein [Enterobacter hormaechei]EKK5925848.1 major capsid protein [Enterobacter hormaechei]
MAKDLFSGAIYESFTSPFVFSTQLNTIITNLGLFREEHHAVNTIALEKITDVKNLVAKENSPYSQSDWSSAKRPDFSNSLYQMKFFGILNSITSLDLQQYASRGVSDTADQVSIALSDFSDAQYSMANNAVEVDLVNALLGLRVDSEFAGQGDLDFLAGGSRTEYTLDVSDTANIFEQLSEITRIQNVALGDGLAQQKQGTVILAAGKAAKALRYHPSVKDFMVYTLPLQSGENFATRTASANPAYEVWTLNGVTVIDVTGYSLITDKIGVDGFAVTPRMADSANALVLHTGIGVRHLTLGKEAALHHQYVIADAKWQFPTIATESSFLAINNIPTAIVFGSLSE